MSKSGIRNATRLEEYGRFIFVCMAAAVIVFGAVRAEEGQESPSREGQTGGPLRLISVEPTVLFVREQGSLLQVAEIELESTSELSEVKVEIKLGTRQRSTGLGNIAKGKAKVQVYVPEIIAATEAEFVVRVGNDAAAQQKMMWQPQRHWKVYVVPITHHDLGYTDTIANVLNKYDGFYEDVIRFCEQTAGLPDESKYRYTVEGTWSLKHFVEHRPKNVIDKFAKYVREGRIEIGALFGNEISGLCGHEELIRLMYPSFRFNRMMGGRIQTGQSSRLWKKL